jgi:AcrR family transcriptional regulator
LGRKSIKEQRRKEVMEALYRCLLKKPYVLTSIKDIGREASINYAMLHYYFKSKEDILLHFIDYIFDRYDTLFIRNMQKLKSKGLDSHELVKKAFLFFNEKITTDKKLQKVFFEIWAIALYNERVNKKVKGMYLGWIDSVTSIMKKEGTGSVDTDTLIITTLAFWEGIGVFSIILNYDKKFLMMLLETFQENVLKSLDTGR